MAFDVSIEDDRWSAAALETLAGQAFGAVEAAHGWAAGRYEAALLGCDDARIAALNAQFREKPTPTNVLSWPALDYDTPTYLPEDPELGDIAIAYETCAREASEQGKPFEHHVSHLLVHGLLHLLGYDHETEQDAARMEAKEREILAKLGISDPYR